MFFITSVMFFATDGANRAVTSEKCQGVRLVSAPMNDALSFRIAAGIHARQVDLNRDEAALKALGIRCADDLGTVIGSQHDPRGLSQRFVGLLKPRRVPTERSFVLGIFLCDAAEAGPSHLAGVLYFLHPEQNPGTWYIPLLLLEPVARGRGIGTAVHAAFARWAAERGARRLLVAVADSNERARRFWCDRLGYFETDSGTWRFAGAPTRKNREFVCQLAMATPMTNRVRLRAA